MTRLISIRATQGSDSLVEPVVSSPSTYPADPRFLGAGGGPGAVGPSAGGAQYIAYLGLLDGQGKMFELQGHKGRPFEETAARTGS